MQTKDYEAPDAAEVSRYASLPEAAPLADTVALQVDEEPSVPGDGGDGE
jgi:hypothetical protein